MVACDFDWLSSLSAFVTFQSFVVSFSMLRELVFSCHAFRLFLHYQMWILLGCGLLLFLGWGFFLIAPVQMSAGHGALEVSTPIVFVTYSPAS